MPAIPILSEEQCKGVGKLNRKLTVRQTSGTEAGTLLADVEFIHEELTIDDCRAIEAYLPGSVEAFERAFGEDSDGRRPTEWKPKNGACRLEFSISPAGRLLYGGRATIRRTVLRVVPRACVLTVQMRLEEFDPDQAAALLKSLGVLVDYQITAARIEGSTEDGTKEAEGGLPFGYSFGSGDLVSLADGLGDPAFVISVGSGQAILRRALIDAPDVVPVVVPASDIANSLRICGPKGGPPGDALAKLAERCPRANPGDLILAILRCQGEGTTECLDQGWTLTSMVGDVLEEMVGTDPLPQAGQGIDLDADLVGAHEPDLDDEDDLPPDADEDRGELLDPSA